MSGVQRLTGLDAAFLQLETPSNHMHVMAAAVLDPYRDRGRVHRPTRSGAWSRSGSTRSSPFRRRLVTVPFSLHHPLWVEDPDFDLDYHVRRVAVPAPGGPRRARRGHGRHRVVASSTAAGRSGSCGWPRVSSTATPRSSPRSTTLRSTAPRASTSSRSSSISSRTRPEPPRAGRVARRAGAVRRRDGRGVDGVDRPPAVEDGEGGPSPHRLGGAPRHAHPPEPGAGGRALHRAAPAVQHVDHPAPPGRVRVRAARRRRDRCATRSA